MNVALNEDGSLPGDPLPFLDAIVWFLVIPVGIVLAIWVLVIASENMKKARMNRTKVDVLTRINE